METNLENFRMKVVWVTHHLPSSDLSDGSWIPGGLRGGAEMSDAEYLALCPDGVDVQIISADQTLANMDVIQSCDRVVVTGTDLLSDEAMLELARLQPMVFAHHLQTRTPARRVLLENAFPFVCHTPAHLAKESEWCDFANEPKLVLSAFDPDDIVVAEKEPFALAASRNHPLKGLNQSRLYAAEHGMELMVATDWSRSEVLMTMANAQWFIHLPLAFESECRAVMEAVLAGCEVITNDNVGITSYQRWRDRAWLRDEIIAAQLKFWSAILP